MEMLIKINILNLYALTCFLPDTLQFISCFSILLKLEMAALSC